MTHYLHRSGFRWSALILIASLLYLAPASADEPPVNPQPIKLSIAEPLSGTLAVWGGGPAPKPIFERFAAIAGERPITLVRAAGDTPSPTGWNVDLLKPTQEIILADDDASVADANKALNDSNAVWVDLPAVPAQRLVAGLQALLDRGGIVGGNVGTLGLLKRIRVLEDLPCDDPSALPRALAADPGLVAVSIPAGSLLLVDGRLARCFGAGPVAWQLPAAVSANYGKAETSLSQAPGAELDLVALSRSAIARLNPAFPPAEPQPPHVEQGSLMIAGGGAMPKPVWQHFIELAGGANSKIVLLPTASPTPEKGEPQLVKLLTELGAPDVQVLPEHTREQVQSPRFTNALRNATGVWFGGGRQWRFLDAYQDTHAEELFRDVLRRGGVIGGTSAGAAVQAELMVRGNPFGNLEISAEGYERGLNFLPGTAIDIHVSERNRLGQLQELIARRPQFLGIALDERTAIEVHGHEFTVFGSRLVHIVDAKAENQAPLKLKEGDRYDLKERKQLPLAANRPR